MLACQPRLLLPAGAVSSAVFFGNGSNAGNTAQPNTNQSANYGTPQRGGFNRGGSQPQRAYSQPAYNNQPSRSF